MALRGQPEDRLIPGNRRAEVAHIDSHMFKPWNIHGHDPIAERWRDGSESWALDQATFRTLSRVRSLPPCVRLDDAACRAPCFGSVPSDPRTWERSPGGTLCRLRRSPVRRRKRSVPLACRRVSRPRDRSISEDPLVHPAHVPSSLVARGRRATPRVRGRPLQNGAPSDVVIEQSEEMGLPIKL